jgi:hypothetical protein
LSRTLTVNNTPYTYPDAGENPGWGEGATDWSQAVTDALNSLLAPGDILAASISIGNNISSLTNITGLLFDTGVVRSGVVTYNVYRKSTANPSGYTETGTLNIVYDDSASPGNKWLLSQVAEGDSGVIFSITDTGQFQYTSSDINSTGYSGIMSFKASTISR